MVSKVGGTLAVLTLLSCGAALSQQTTFTSGQNTLAAYYQKPLAKPKGVVLFVHGDGERPYDADGYYQPIWHVLNEKSYGVFSWDKPGVGDSTGNWLSQSMADRQSEVLAAIAYVKKTYGYKPGQIGLMGFSQAGWVVPAVASRSPDVGFIIGVGFAINWLDQSWFLTKTRLNKSGATAGELAAAYQQHMRERQFWRGGGTYERYITEYGGGDSALTKPRFRFIEKNVFADALGDYKNLTQPALFLLGANDQNVDVAHTEKVLARLFRGRANVRIAMIPHATHALLKLQEFGNSAYGLWFWLKLMWQGKDAFAPEFFPVLDDWLAKLERPQ